MSQMLRAPRYLRDMPPFDQFRLRSPVGWCGAIALVASACATDAPSTTSTASAIDLADPVVLAMRESYLQAQIVPGRPLPAPIARGAGGTFVCGTAGQNLGVQETRTRDGRHTYRMRCARSTERGVVEDHLTITLDETRASEVDRASAQACVSIFGRYRTPRNEYFQAELGLSGARCASGPNAIATQLAGSAATGGAHTEYLTPGLPHPAVPADVIPPAPLLIAAKAGQLPTLPAWAIVPTASAIMLTSAPTEPLRLSVQSRGNPADLTTFDPAAYPSQVIGYTVQFATEPTGLTSCEAWHDAPGVFAEQFVALADQPVAANTLPSGLPIWLHDLEVPLPWLDFGPWTDDANLSHTLWVRAVPRGPVLGGEPGDPPLPGVPGIDPSPCALVPSNWMPVGVFDDALYQEHVANELQQMLAATLAKLPYNASDLYTLKVIRYVPPRLVARAPIEHVVPTGPGTTMTVPVVPRISEHTNEWGAVRGKAYDAWHMTAVIDYAHQTGWEWLTDPINAFIDLLGLASELYESAKTFVANAAAKLTCAQVPIDGCADFVAPVAKLGIEYGLASMGIPPHIPNARELMNRGVDYLASMAADAVADKAAVGGPLAAEAARTATYTAASDVIHETLDSLPATFEYDNDRPESWGSEDPFYLPHPASITIAIRPKSPAAYAQILAAEPQRIPDLGFVVLRDLYCGYAAKSLRLPRVIPPQGLVVTLPLTAAFEVATPGTALPGQTCKVPDATTWGSSFGALDPTYETIYGVRYPSSTRSYIINLLTFDWLTKKTKSWDAVMGSVGNARVFAKPSVTPTAADGVFVPTPFP